jgi:hypothetical protein
LIKGSDKNINSTEVSLIEWNICCPIHWISPNKALKRRTIKQTPIQIHSSFPIPIVIKKCHKIIIKSAFRKPTFPITDSNQATQSQSIAFP